jgi:hypothetical protein
MEKVVKHITNVKFHISKNKTEKIEKTFSKEYSHSIELYLKEEVKKYEKIEVIILNRPTKRK